jgi:hypothetical protein
MECYDKNKEKNSGLNKSKISINNNSTSNISTRTIDKTSS